MYIKSIKAQGFKSFADKIEFDLNNNQLCAIVGPNGSGKSNIVDALLWVLGEQSVKQLRGDANMSDVIFMGSKSREEAKKATVAITFNNEDHALNTDFKEVEIKRIIYRTGENEYFINDARVRLKDITDLFLDVTSKFNIITQGNIAALVDNKSSERRILFESAAGVLKYKKRKEESLKKLEGVKENLTRISLITKELDSTLEPLKEQKEVATKYLEYKKELENIEVSLLASEITSYNEHLENLKNNNEDFQKRLNEMPVNKPEKLEKLKLEIIRIDEEINVKSNEVVDLSNQIASLNSQKQINIERKELNADKERIDKKLVSLKEDKLDLERKKDVLEHEINSLKKDLQEVIKEYNDLSNEEIKLKLQITNNTNAYNLNQKEIMQIQNKIDIENANNENNAFLPKSITSIINNPRLSGIHNTIKNVLDIKEEYFIAISSALGASSNFVIVNSLNDAKMAINYLKENKLGKGTFFPIDTIKSRYLDAITLEDIKIYEGFIGIASDLVSFDNKYRNIIENQLGNVLICKDMDSMFQIAKNTNYRFKLVSLEGEVLFPGGSISGGTNTFKDNKSVLLNLKNSLEKLKRKNESLDFNLKNNQREYDTLTIKISNLNKKIADNKVLIESKEWGMIEYKEKLDTIKTDLKNLGDLKDGQIDSSINELLEKISDCQKEKEIKEQELKNLQSKKFDINDEITTLEKEYQTINSEHHSLENKINNNDIEIAKLEIKIDNSINILTNDYNITYDYAMNNYDLNIDINSSRNKVNHLKNALKELKEVNLGSINEYDRLKKRYDFLDKQKSDLDESSNELLKLIEEMDEIMKEKLKETFDQISEEFTKVFRVMFKGGNGLLKLTDENDLLNTNINILAVPPGKKLNSITALSGGEKALTAICLIFAILNVKPSPFIVLDEAEAALDEDNVRMFGEYLNNMKKQSQFILITHKKKMMEYADTLYGITMQESGVSRLVSVKLDN